MRFRTERGVYRLENVPSQSTRESEEAKKNKQDATNTVNSTRRPDNTGGLQTDRKPSSSKAWERDIPGV